jgi:iron complex transport system substrate-binding protein
MKPWQLSLLALISIGWLLPPFGSTAQPAASAGFGITVTDALGRKVTFDRAPQRIAIAGRALIMVSDALYLFPQASQRIAAIARGNQSGHDFLSIVDPSFGNKTLLEPNAGAEQIASVKPDLVILKNMMVDRLGKALERLNIPVLYVDLETPEQYTRDITMLGQIMGNPDRAQQVVRYYQQRWDAVKRMLSDLTDAQKPRVLVLQYTKRGGETALNVPPAAWIQTTMVLQAGGVPVWTKASQRGGWTVVNLEQVAAWNPDQIYIISYKGNAKDIVTLLKADPSWRALKAVREDRLFGFAGDFCSWDQPDTRWLLGMMWLATKIQPDRAKSIDIMKEVNQFYAELYNLQPNVIQHHVKPLLSGSIP